MAEFPDEGWMEAFRNCGARSELAVIGHWFNVDMGLVLASAAMRFESAQGKIEEIIPSPRFDVRTQFQMRAPMASWQRFLSEPLPALPRHLQ